MATPDSVGPTDPEELETFFDGLMAAHMASHHIPGAVVAVVKDDALLFAKGYGHADLERDIPVEAERTLFRPGSISKLFTWTAVMQLVEEGRLSLDADVNQYLDFDIPSTYPQPVTLAHLMTHTPGFEDQGRGLFVLEEEKLVSLETYLKMHLPARVYPPGEVGAYSNYGTALAGYIVQRVSGQPFAAYVEEYILEPLGMSHSTFRQPLPSTLAEDMARGYGYAQGAYLPGEFELVAGSPAGSLSATATDMAHFMIAHLHGGAYGGQRILQPASVAEMQAAHFVPDPHSPGMGYGFFRTTYNRRLMVFHEGDTTLFHSGLYLLPATQGQSAVGLFVSYSSAGGTQARPELLQAFLDRYLPSPGLAEPADDANTRLEAYTGEYHLARANYTTVEKILKLLQPMQVAVGPEGHLTISLLGETKQYVEIEPGLVREMGGDVQASLLSPVIFLRDDEGQVTGLVPADLPPLTAFKAPWYATLTFTGALLVGGLVVFLLTLLGWVVAYVTTRAHGPGALPPLWARVARWVTTAFVLVTVVFLVGLFSVMGDINPTYGVPNVFFGEAPGLNALMALTYVIAALAAGMLGMTIVAWWQRYWGWFGRIWYSLLTVVGLAWVWMLATWNLLGPGF